MQTDPIADMLARIKNANRALHETVELPSSRLKAEIARLLKEEGYIRDYRIVSSEDFNQGEENKKKHRAYDTLVQTFPALVIARTFGFTVRPYFELDPIARDSGPPPVDLSGQT